MKRSEQMQQAMKVAITISTFMASSRSRMPRVRAEPKPISGKKRVGTVKSMAKAGPMKPAAKA